MQNLAKLFRDISLSPQERREIKRILNDPALLKETLSDALVLIRTWKQSSRAYDRVQKALLKQ